MSSLTNMAVNFKMARIYAKLLVCLHARRVNHMYMYMYILNGVLEAGDHYVKTQCRLQLS